MFGCVVLVAHGAAANCMPPVPHKEKVTLRAVHQPVANAQGRAMRGCILEIGEGRYAYSVADTFCGAAQGSSVQVELSRTCCDSSFDAGDAACVARTADAAGESIRSRGALIAPVDDKR